MVKMIVREVLVWGLSIAIATLIWYPIFSKISYAYLPLGIFSITVIIQFFRWFVFYDHIVLFRSKIGIVSSILIAFAIGVIVWSKGQQILLISENQIVEDIATSKVNLGLEETYKLFEYLRTLLALCNFVTPGVAFMLILKIIYRTIGLGSNKVKSYLGK